MLGTTYSSIETVGGTDKGKGNMFYNQMLFTIFFKRKVMANHSKRNLIRIEL